MKKFLHILSALFLLSIVNCQLSIAQNITVTAPNGGEIWIGCSVHSITWTSSGVSNYFNIDYSTDGGSNWVSVASNYNTTGGSYSWTVPNLSSVNCLVRVLDNHTPTIVDQSNAVFSINAPIIVTSPNGGEVWQGVAPTTGALTAYNMSNTNQSVSLGAFYDAGGASANYPYASYTQTYSPASPNNAVQFTFSSFSTYPYGYDYLYIYDGANTSAPLLGQWDGSPTVPFTVTASNASGQLTAYFAANSGTSSYPGWAASIALVPFSTEITWAATGTSNYYNIDYSTDNGATWTNIVTNYYTTTGVYIWQVPNIPSVNCRVRVTDNQSACRTDQSNAAFTILAAPATITVMSPNGGEYWMGASSHNITWTSSNISSNFVKLEYSLNNGSTWTTIVSAATNNGTYAWTVPSISSVQALVRVSDSNTPTTNDVSNAVFTIDANPVITVTAPNGGEGWYAGTTQNITWTSAYLSGSNVKIEYSIDNGSTWLSVVASVTNSGTYAWTVPNNATTTALVRVSDAGNVSTHDVSNAVFTLYSYIVVTAPNGGEAWDGCSSHSITWNRGGTTNYFKIEYSTNNGSTWTTVVSSYTGTSATAQSYSWIVPNIATTTALVRVSDTTDVSKIDQSNAVFTINGTTSIIVTSPNGGEVWTGTAPTTGSVPTYNMSNTAQTVSIGNFYDAGGASGYYPYASYTQTYTPATAGNALRFTFSSFSTYPYGYDYLYIYDGANTSAPLIGQYDGTTSPGTVTATNASGQLTFYFAANSGTNSYPGWAASISLVPFSTNISWAASGVSNYYNIDYSTNSGSTWTNIVTDYYTTAGFYVWAVPNITTTTALARVTDYNNTCKSDQSNAVFTINPAPSVITLLSPNGGEYWMGASAHNITWTSSNLVSTFVKLEYSLNNGSTWTTIVGSTNNTGTYSWTVPSISSTHALVRASDAGNISTNSVSAAVFTIDANPVIAVTAPNGAENWYAGTTQNITWTSAYLSGSTVKIEYSVDSGLTWLTVVASTSNTGSYTWTIPNNASAHALVKVSDAGNLSTFDVSNAVFNLWSYIVVTAPNGGENWAGCSTQNITWNRGGTTNNFKIEYSTNNGSTWTTVVASYAGTAATAQTYSWLVPNTSSTTALVRVSDAADATKIDQSNAVFTISGTTSIVVNAPNGGETYQGIAQPAGTLPVYNMSNTALTVTNGNYYDAGGASGNYPYASYTQTFTPGVPNTLLSFNFSSFSTYQGGYDYLYIYDGANTSAPLLGQWDGSTGPGTVTATNSAGKLTFYFYSNSGTGSYPGWAASITCIPNTDVITWASTGTSNYYNIDYSTNNGSTWINAATNFYTTANLFYWDVPNTPTTTALVRVTDYNNTCKTDQSNAVFTITSATPYITLVSPNGGQSYLAGQTQNITWYSAALASTFVKLEYSSDNGATWNVISAATNNTGSYAWTIPNITSSQCLVRVSDYGNLATNAVSNATFTIGPYITITSPNGGESWAGCSSYLISWTAGVTSMNYKIEYSLNNGSTWTTIIASTTMAGTNCNYAWSVPNSASTTCLVRVSDANDLTKTDVSNAVFTITANASIVVTSPNGAEIWQGVVPTTGTLTPYNMSNTNQSVSLGTFYDAGGASGNYPYASYTQTYSPATPNNAVKFTFNSFSTYPYGYDYLYVYDGANTSAPLLGQWDASPTVPFSVTASNSSGQLTAYFAANSGTSSYPGWAANISLVPFSTEITWTATGTSNYFNIDYSTDGGTTWISIVANYYTTTYSYIWSVPNTASTNCKVRVTDANSACKFDLSNNPFTILAAPSVITVVSPNGGENWAGASVHNITWSSSNLSGNNVKLEYSLDNGNTWTTIVTTTNGGTYPWTVPSTGSTQALVKVSDAGNLATKDSSNAVFTITANPIITVTSPNGGEGWYAGTTQNITWTSAYLSGSNVKIEYSTDNGSTWVTIAATVANSGTYSWTVPNAPSTSCLVKVSDAGNLSTFDVSNAVFTIYPYITVTAPNGGESWNGCTTQSITWNRGGTTNNYKIEYSLNNGGTWFTIIASYAGTTATPQSYSWLVPNTASVNCLVRVSDAADLTKTDNSNAVFTINATTSIIVTSPNGGEVWVGTAPTTGSVPTYNMSNTNQTVSNGNFYDAGGASGNYPYASYTQTFSPATPGNALQFTFSSFSTYPYGYDYLYIYDGSSTSSPLIGQYGGTTSPGTVTATNASGQLTFRFVANSGTGSYAGWAAAISLIPFSTNISWAASGVSNYYNIDYSTNNGTTWTSIVANYYTTNNFYVWAVPNTSTANALVRVTDANNTCKTDQSNAVFTITAAPSVITVISPNGGEYWMGASAHNITWTSSNISSSFVKIEYSLNNSSTWNTVIASTNNNGTYAWTVPSTSSTHALVRVSDAGNLATYGISNAIFTIDANPVITVTAPNGGESWYAGTSQNITWTSAYLSGPNVKIEYSTDNGSTWTTVVASTGNTGSYTWTVPNTPSTQALVRVSDATNLSTFDVSNADFTINPYIIITSPNGGENWAGCSAQNITWNRGGTTNNYKLEYSTNNGSTWNVIVASYAGTTATTQSYSWVVPNTASTNCLVRVSDAGDLTKTDNSNAVFTINGTTSIIVTSPNGGEVWQGVAPVSGTLPVYNMSNTSLTVTQGNYYDAGGSAGNYPYASYTQTFTPAVPNTALSFNFSSFSTYPYGYDYLYIYDGANTSSPLIGQYDGTTSPGIVTASNAAGQLTFRFVANSGAAYPGWAASITCIPFSTSITWLASGTSNYYNIDYSTNGGVSWTNIVTNYYSTNLRYVWSVPNTASTTCLVRVTDYNNSCKTAQSANLFTINAANPNITVVSPNGGENLCAFGTQNITWYSSAISSAFVKIEYSTNSGSTWTTITSATNNNGSYSWTVPNMPSANCIIRVSDFSNSTTNGVSSAVFTIAPSILVTAPNGGETIGGCTTSSISWTSCGTGTNYLLEYSINGGTTWTTIVASYSATGSNCNYTWSVPNTPSTNCLVRVTDISNTLKVDQSNAVFTISPTITITQPNFGGSLVVGAVTNITWNSVGASNYYNIDYSINGGTSWLNIVTNYNTTLGTYAWTVPNNVSANCLVRVTDYFANCKTGTSANAFTITAITPAITVTSPNGGESWNGCTSHNITWTSSGTSGSYTIQYSTNGGATWINIVTNQSISTGTYAWTVPGVPSSTCLVKVFDSNTPTKVDQSNAAFTIVSPIANAGQNTAICTGSGTTLSASGGISYSWTPTTGLSNAAIANPLANPTSTTTYTVTVSDVNGCTGTSSVVVTVNPIPSVTVSPSAPSVCAGSSVSLTASGATTYSWLPTTALSSATVANPNASPSSTTTYTVTGTTNGCSGTATVVTTVVATPTVTASGTATICAGASTGLAASGATTYSWSPSLGLNNDNTSNPTATPPLTVTYTVTGTTNGCTGTAPVTITVNTVPSLSISPPSSAICAGGSTTITASGATSYTWSPSSNLSSASIANPVATPSSTTTYTVTGITGTCSSTSSIIVTVNVIPTVTATGGATICSGHSTPLTASGATTYQWTPATGLSSSTIANPAASPTTTTTYTVTGTTNACLNTGTVTVTVNPTPVANAGMDVSICPGGHTTLSASGGTTYSWTPTASLSNANIANPVATPSVITTYTVTATTGSCSSTDSVIVSFTTVVANAGSPVTICPGNTTTLNASGGTTYSWSPVSGLSNPNISNPVATPNTTTTYTVTATTGSCSSTASVVVTVAASLTVSISPTSASICTGGSSSLTASGASTYSWLPTTGLSNASIANPVATPSSTTTYTVTGTSGSCTSTSSIIVTVNPLPATPTITAGGATSFCSGGSVTLTSSSTTGNSWTPGSATTQQITANASGSYTVTVTNGSGCSATSAATTVTVYPLPTANAGTNVSITSGTSTTLAGSASGGTSPYTYSWTPSASLVNAAIQNPTTVNLSTTTIFTLTVNDNHSCQSTSQVTVTVGPSTATVSGGIVSELNAAVRTVTVNVTGGATQNMTTAVDGLYSFTLTPGQSDTIRPTKNNDVSVTNGITTLDILLIQRHILNTVLLSSPYKIIAADVNLSGTVTTLDILLIRSLILGNTTSFPHGMLWNFVPSDFVFANPTNPFPFNNFKYYPSVSTQTSQNFIGMKLGDVNNSWDPTVAKTGYVGAVNIDMPSGNVLPGEQIKLPVTARQFKSMSGYQFTINWNPAIISFVGVENAAAVNGEYGLLKQAEGAISVLWTADNAESLDLADETALFYLTFKAIGKTGDVSTISISSDITPIEAVNNNLDLVELKSNAGTVSIGQLTIDNGQLTIYPNPNSGSFTIELNLPSKENVSLKVMNTLGQVVFNEEYTQMSGVHNIPVNLKPKTAGVYFVKLQTEEGIMIKKVLVDNNH